jgi:hypothetical protein
MDRAGDMFATAPAWAGEYDGLLRTCDAARLIDDFLHLRASRNDTIASAATRSAWRIGDGCGRRSVKCGLLDSADGLSGLLIGHGAKPPGES